MELGLFIRSTDVSTDVSIVFAAEGAALPDVP